MVKHVGMYEGRVETEVSGGLEDGRDEPRKRGTWRDEKGILGTEKGTYSTEKRT